MGKKKSYSVFDILRSIGQGFWALLKGLIRLILKILVTFGLWLPGLYAVLGVILYYGLNFNPFDFSVYSIIYLSGAFACVICAVIISLRNIIVNPVKKAFSRKKNVYEELEDGEFEVDKQADEQRQREEEERFYSSRRERREEPVQYLYQGEEQREEQEPSASSLLFDWVPEREEKREEPKVKAVPKKEVPEVYFSKLNPNILVHEYSDRFELYKMMGDRTEYLGVEYKQ